MKRLPRWMLGAVFSGGLVLLCGVAMTGAWRAVLPEDGQTVRATFATTGKLAEGAPVRVRGVDVGRVERVRVDQGGRSATVTMLVGDDALPVHADARAAIKYRTLLGGNLAIDLDPGNVGRLDGPIPLRRTSSQVELDDVTSALTADARKGLRSTLRETPVALADADLPAEAFDATASEAPDIGRAAAALRGSYDGELRVLVRNTGRLATAVADRAGSARELVEDGATTVTATARRRAEIQESVNRAPAVLRSTRATADRLDTTLALADPVIAALQRPARDLAPTLRDLRPVLEDADALLADAQPLLRAARPAARDLRATARNAAPLVSEVEPSVRRVADDILPGLAEVDPVTKRPTYQMIGPTFAGLTGAAGQFDSEARWFRFPALGGVNSVNTLPCRVYAVNPEENRLLECQQLLETFDQVFRGRGKQGARR